MTIEELHDHLFDVLCVVDKICRENNLTYWLHGGSAIGMVREHDFIPWDDDVDILIKVEDYPRFKAVMTKELPDHFHFIEPVDYFPFFYDFIPKIVDDRFLLRTENAESRAYKNFNNRVGIDIFILSGFPKNRAQQSLWLLKYNIIFGLGMKYRYTVNYDKYSLKEKCQIMVLRGLSTVVSGKTPKTVFMLWERLLYASDAVKTEMRMISNTTPNCYWHPMPQRWFNDTVFLKFRETELPVEKEYDAILSQAYGNYMKPDQDGKKYIVHLTPEKNQSN